jgi:myo-inositol-hexaphosphate 3-phosphohydrolase
MHLRSNRVLSVPAVFMMILLSSCAAPVPAPPSPTPGTIPVATSTQSPTAVPTDNPRFEPFGTVNIDSGDIKFEVNGSGSDVDSIAFWEAPDPTESLMIVTSKGNEYTEVYKYPFTSELTTISCGEASNGVWVDQDRDILYLTGRNSNLVCAFDLPSLERDDDLSFNTAATENDSEPNLTILVLPNGQRRIYVSYDEIVFYHDAETGQSLGEFEPSKGLETMYGDPYYQALYIPDESDQSGVYLYDPDGTPAGTNFGGSSIFDADEEGIWVYKCPSTGTEDNGEGLILVSDQKEAATEFETFNRETKEYLGSLKISGVSNTDGIAITQQAFPDYPLGLLAVIDDDTSTVGVGWDTILSKTGLSCGS